jgi:hypothetical protein
MHHKTRRVEVSKLVPGDIVVFLDNLELVTGFVISIESVIAEKPTTKRIKILLTTNGIIKTVWQEKNQTIRQLIV